MLQLSVQLLDTNYSVRAVVSSLAMTGLVVLNLHQVSN